MLSLRDIEIQILVDNQGDNNDLAVEHGFSAWIEVPGRAILFDTGQGLALEKNAGKLKRALSGVDEVVLSHGHYDHTGGLPAILERNTRCGLWAHRDCMVERYSIHEAEHPRDVSIPKAAGAMILELDEERVHWIDGPRRVAPGVWLTGPIPRAHPLEDTGGPFYLDRQGIRRDLLQDDLSLWLETEKGLVVVTGCCHSGIMNTIDFIQAQTGGKPVHAIVGGLHLHSASPARLEATIQAIGSWGTPSVTASHCTGLESTNRLQAMLGAAVIRGYAGLMVRSGGS